MNSENSKEHGFVDKRAMITTVLISCHQKALMPFCLWKKIPKNAFLTLTVNYHTVTQKNELFHSKQH